ncbi:unnamed protein product [Ectocarpus fasciculatus]
MNDQVRASHDGCHFAGTHAGRRVLPVPVADRDVGKTSVT